MADYESDRSATVVRFRVCGETVADYESDRSATSVPYLVGGDAVANSTLSRGTPQSGNLLDIFSR